MSKDIHIEILSDLVSSQIAAGEVVDRPVSVVKELIENSLDAGSSIISIQLGDAGKSLIVVEDNGEGILSDELMLAVTRHATSKIKETEDLGRITTLGFRGEALASIGSVARMQIASKHRSESFGSFIRSNGGVISNLEKIPLTDGTRVRVENLFFNLPARLKFLKNDQTETNLVNELIQKYATEYSCIQFKYSANEKCKLITSGKGDMSEGLTHLFGLDSQKQMLFIQSQESSIEIKGFISPISLSRSNRKGITFFVNGRWVQDNGMVSSFLRAYQSMLMVGRFPFCFLSIKVPPEEIDVNVHPAKSQIRIKNAEAFLSFIHREVKKSITQVATIPQFHFSNWHTTAVNLEQTGFPKSQFLNSKDPNNSQSNQSEFEGKIPNQMTIAKIPILRAIGQIGLTYIIAEGPDGLYLIDQHAAHERILFERYNKQSEHPFSSQLLLEHAILNLKEDESLRLRNILEPLQAFGFKIEEFGNFSFIIRAIPQTVNIADTKNFLYSILDENDNEINLLNLSSQNNLVAKICKKLAIKSGQALSLDEQKKLLEDLENCDNPRVCPHGRTTMIHLSVDLLERQFGRRGSV